MQSKLLLFFMIGLFCTNSAKSAQNEKLQRDLDLFKEWVKSVMANCQKPKKSEFPVEEIARIKAQVKEAQELDRFMRKSCLNDLFRRQTALPEATTPVDSTASSIKGLGNGLKQLSVTDAPFAIGATKGQTNSKSRGRKRFN